MPYVTNKMSKPQDLRTRSQYWCFTDFKNVSPSYEVADLYRAFRTRQGKNILATYFCVGLEVCPKTGNLHYQGYIELDNPVTIVTLKTAFPSTHWEIRRGNCIDARNYCRKEGLWIEAGSISDPQQGKRTDLDTVRAMALSGVDMRDIVTSATSFQAIRMAEKIREYVTPRRSFVPVVKWYWGATGTGKTRLAIQEATAIGGDGYWISGKTLRWWQGYDRQSCVIIDDFRGDFCTFHELLRILDRYPYTVEVKGGSRELVATHMWITCPHPPTTAYYDRTTEDLQQLLRRISEIRQFMPESVPSEPELISE